MIVLTPLYFAEPLFASLGRPPVSYPEYLYGFVTLALACQWLYWLIGRDPVRFRPVMPVAFTAKFAFFILVATLVALGRTDLMVLAGAVVDLALAILFAIAWRRTPAI